MVEPIDIEFPEGSDNCVASCQCVSCRKIVKFDAPAEGIIEYLYHDNRRKIQDCMPNVLLQHREMLMSGICPECFDSMFKPMDEEN